MGYVANMSGVVKSGPIPEGLFLVQVKDTQIKETQGKPGNLNLVVTYTILDMGGDETHAGREIKNQYISLGENSKGIFKAFAEAASGESWDTDGIEWEPADFVGKVLRLMIYHDKQKFPKIRAYYPETGELD